MSGIDAINSNMDNGTNHVVALLAFMELNTNTTHELIIAHGHMLAVDISLNAIAGNLTDILDLTTVLLIRVSLTQGSGYWVGGEPLDMGGKVKEFLLVHLIRVDSLNGKNSFGQGTCLVEHHSAHLRQSVHIVSTFYKYTVTAGSANTAEECQRNGDNQCARATDYKECQRTVDPVSPSATQNQWRDNGKGNSRENNNRGIDMGELADECLTFRLIVAGILYKVDNLRGGRLSESLRHLYFQHARLIDTSGDDGITNLYTPRHTLAGQCNGVQRGCALDNLTVKWNLITGTNDNGFTYLYVFRVNGKLLLARMVGRITENGSHIGADTHQMID